MSYLENLTAKQQKDVLEQRTELRRRFGPKDFDKINVETLDKLKGLSPEGLKPAIIWSIKHGWMAGFLIQKLARGSFRVLVMIDDWRIIRVRDGATVLKVTGAFEQSFGELLSVQRNFFTLMYELSDALRSKKHEDVPIQKGLQPAKDRKNRPAKISNRRTGHKASADRR